MTLHVETLDEKLAAVERLIPLYRAIGRAKGDDGTYGALKAIAADLRARLDHPRGDASCEILRALTLVQTSRTERGYDLDALTHLAEVLNNRWPLVSQALELFGRDSGS